MKTNFYILLILLLSVSITKAQSTTQIVEIEKNKTISVSSKDEITTATAELNTIKENNSLLIDAAKVNEAIARSSSDIRIYLNRKRKVSNINLIFKGINKAVKA